MSMSKAKFQHRTYLPLLNAHKKYVCACVILTVLVTLINPALAISTDNPPTNQVSLSTTINVYEDDQNESTTPALKATNRETIYKSRTSTNTTSGNRTNKFSNVTTNVSDSLDKNKNSASNDEVNVTETTLSEEASKDSASTVLTEGDTVTVTVIDVTSRNSSLGIDTGPRHIPPAENGGIIAGIVIGILVFVALAAGLGLYLFYLHTREKKAPPSVTSTTKFGDNCGYLDDTVRVSYINSHIELPKETSEEMMSLDNDSFLNSLEAMTIQNYWADNTKNTKV